MENPVTASAKPDLNARIIDKIKKCLALAESQNAHEAATALRQANSLMKLHGIDHSQVNQSTVGEARIHLGAGKNKPPAWRVQLASSAAAALGCIVLIATSRSMKEFLFIGPAGMPQLATYAYGVLERQLLADRKRNSENMDSRLSSGKKRRLTNLYSQAWSEAVYEKVRQYGGVEPAHRKAVNEFIAQKFGSPPQRKDRPLKVKQDEIDSLIRGLEDGEKANLHTPISTTHAPVLNQIHQ